MTKLLNCILICTLIILPYTVAENDEKCTHKSNTNTNKTTTTKLKLGAIASILGAGAIGVALPLLGKRIPVLRPEHEIFFMIKAFAAGVILATGFIHILPDAFESLTSECLPDSPWKKFPFTGLVAMAASIGSLMVDSLATGHFSRTHCHDVKEGGGSNKVDDVEKSCARDAHVHSHTHVSHAHAEVGQGVLEVVRHRVTAQVLELGIVVHSVIIGISLGTSRSVDTIKPLMIALSFHQFFEGMGLGGCICQAQFKSRAMATMALFFSLTTPIGIVIGIAISGVYQSNSPRTLIIQGVFESAAAGILIYMALVDLLAADFRHPRMQQNIRIQLGSHLSLLLGAACMSFLAVWAGVRKTCLQEEALVETTIGVQAQS